MSRPMPPGLSLLVVLVVLACATGCSDDSEPSTRAAPRTSVSAPARPPDTSPGTTSPATTGRAPSSSTTSVTGGSGSHTDLRITNFRGPGTVECNAPTQVELHWEAAGAPEFELRVDGGPVLATYPSGTRTELVPFDCDGSHVYELSATVDGSTTKTSVSVESKPFDN